MRTLFGLVVLLFGVTGCGTPPSDARETFEAQAAGPRAGVSRWDGRFGEGSDGLPGMVERDVLRW
jgi:hypothetical protein